MSVNLSDKEKEKIRLEFGLLLKKKRKSLGMSQDELAFQSGLHRTYVSSVERGERNISIENIFLLAITLKCRPHELIPLFTKKKKTLS